MGSLFEAAERANREKAKPLAARLRPESLDDFVGQEQFLGPGKLLRRLLEADRLSSVIFYGPAGTGKTSLAHVIANQTQASFTSLNAAASSVKELRECLRIARDRLELDNQRTILFIDELHRFNRSQQDVLLPDVEEGIVILIGATTQNPFFAINSPLISRSQIFQFQSLSRDNITSLLRKALLDPRGGLQRFNVELTEEAAEFIAEICDGDARRALGALEVGVLSVNQPGMVFDLEVAQDSIQQKAPQYDGSGDQHYDVASAFIKSMRGTDPDAAVYWLAHMLEAGEDPRFIARRIVICASEDVGNADPMALVVATAALQASEFVGMPECQLALSQAVTYIACAHKSNAATTAIANALKDVREGRTLEVPRHLRDAHYGGASQLGNGEGYQYAHNHAGGWVDQEYLPERREYYKPTDRGAEAEFKTRLKRLRALREGEHDA